MNHGLSLRRGVFGALALFICAMLTLTGLTLWHLRQKAIDTGLTLAESKTRSFEDYLTQSLNATAQVASFIAVPPAGIKNQPAAQAMLEQSLRQTPHWRSISLLDESGRIVASSNPANVGVKVATDDYLPRASPTAPVLRIGQPWSGRDFADGWPSATEAPVGMGAQHFFPVIQPLPSVSKPLFVLVAVNPDHFVGHVLQTFDLTLGHLSVYLYDGTLLMDTSHDARPGAQHSQVVNDLKLDNVESGSFTQTSPELGVALTAYRASSLYPLVLVTRYRQAQALAPWRAEATVLLTVVLSTLFVVVLVTSLFYRRQTQHLALKAQAMREQDISATVFNASTQAIIISDPQGNILSVNLAFTRISGYLANEVIGQNPRLLSSGLQTPAFYAAMWQAVIDHGVWEGEIVNAHKNGTLYDIHLTITAVRNEVGEVVHLIGVSSDITERKRLAKELSDKMRLLGTVLDNSSVGISFVRHRHQMWANQQMAAMFGYTLAEMTNIPTRLLYPSDSAFDQLGQQGYETLARGKPFSTEMPLRRKDGTLLWVRLSGKAVNPTHYEDGSIWVFEDISEQRQTQRQLQDAKDAAEAANLAKSRFLATMSHEIRTPMNGVLGMAQLLLLPNLTEAQRLDYVQTILSSGQTLLSLLNDILDLSKIEAGKFQLESNPFDPAQVLGEVTTLFKGTAQAKGLMLSHGWVGPVGQLYRSDAYRLRQMLSNLVGNALKFTAKGQVQLQATEVSRQGDTVLLEFAVQDTGMGIPVDKQNLLFKPFSQADNSTTRQFGGSGLGLSIVRNLAIAMGGEVGLQSAPGQGSRFWFRIKAPLGAQALPHEEDHHIHAAQPDAVVAPAPAKLQGHLLVAEDNPVNAMVIESMLTRLGLTMTLAVDGQVAVDTLAQCDPDQWPKLVLMDLQMPVMDGYTATQRIRSFETHHQRAPMPIIALTADAFEEDRQHCLAVGMNDVLTKPINIALLKATLAKWLSPE